VSNIKICVVTGSRAEFGLLYCLLKKINLEKTFQLELIVTGSHLEKEFGKTINEITSSGINISKKINIVSNDYTKIGITKSITMLFKSMPNVLNKIKPNLMIILGDRYEIFGSAICAYFLNIPIAHFHGGELTYGSIDDGLRHSITKLSHFHFVSNKIYKDRIIQMGENPKKIFIVGGMGVENIKKTKKLNKNQLQKILKIKFSKKNILATFHPLTIKNSHNKKYINNILKALDQFSNINIFFTRSNADSDNLIINKEIVKYVKKNPKKCFYFNSLGMQKYLSLLKNVDCIIGNSSSGIIEAPSLSVPTINIGNRQSGRLKANSIIDCNYEVSSIVKAINKIYSKKFSKKLLNLKNPYGIGNSSKKSINILKKIDFKNIKTKVFFDLKKVL